MNPIIEKISDAEFEIMKVIWNNDSPVTYTHIRTALTQQEGGNWEGPTINTLVNRMVKKGALVHEKQKVFYYSATVTKAEYMEAKTKLFIHKFYEGNTNDLLAALVTYKEISIENLDNIMRFLKECCRQDE